jgi:hypothetical protein
MGHQLEKSIARGRFFTDRSTFFAHLAVTLVFAVLAWRQHFFVDLYAVNVLFWDQWDFYTPLFQNSNLWEVFDRQHGPHRQGIGFILTSILAQISGWNSRWDAFGASFVLMGAAGLGLLLARRCGARGLGLVVVPLLFFNIRQYETFVGATNISHGVMPVFLFMGLCLSWFLRPVGLRLAMLCLLTFLLIFTGFGLFAGLLVPLLLAVQATQYFRGKENKHGFLVLLGLLGVGMAWALFAYGYHFDPAVEGFRFPYEKPSEYFYFVASMLNNFHGIRGHGIFAMTMGFGIIALLTAVAVWHGVFIVRNNAKDHSRSAAIFCLAAFALIYCFETAVGRVCLGWKDASATSRYVTLMIPAGLALYLHVSGLKNRALASALSILYAVLLLSGTVRLHNSDWRSIHTFSDGRLAWKAAYLKTHDLIQANEFAGFLIYPTSQLEERLRFLEKNRINLFNSNGLP